MAFAPRTLGFLAVFCLVLVSAARADEPEIYMNKGGLFSEAWDYAVKGYDTVAYFTDNALVAGDDAYVAEYKGVKWRFASQEHLDLFKAEPDRYRPRYGGYCAWAMAQGKLAEGGPQYWTVHKGKLYLNLNANIQRRWLQDPEGFIAKADVNWPGILKR